MNKFKVGDKVKALTHGYVEKGSILNVVENLIGSAWINHREVQANYLNMSYVVNNFELVGEKNELLSQPIKSDGGSSSYYDIQLPNWLVEEIYSRYEKGQGFIKTEELIEVAFKNDFDFGTTFKALVRGFGSLNGGGKEGNDVEYEMNKVGYYSNRVKQRTSR